MGKKKKQLENLTEYIFPLASIRKNEEANTCLYQYLQQTYNTEPLEFLDLVDKIQEGYNNNKKDSSSFYELANSIVKSHVQLNSMHEINISARDRQQLLDAVEKQQDDLQICMNQFNTVKTIVEGEMENDVMPRFLRSSLWLNMVNKRGKTWIDKVGVLKKAVEMEYTDEDFKHNYIEDRDFAFMRYLARDSYDWKLLGFDKSQQIMAFSSKSVIKYFPKTKWVNEGAAVFKYVGILQFPFDTVEHYMLHAKYVNEFDANVTNQRTVQYLSFEDLKQKYPSKDMKSGRSVCVMIYDVKFPFPFANRVYCVNSSAMHDPITHESITMSKPCFHEALNEYDMKKVCLFTDFQIYSIKKLDDQRTMYCQLHIVNMGSSTGNKLSKLVAFNRAKQLSSNITKFMNTHIKNDKVVPQNDTEDGLMRPLLDHKKYLQEQQEQQEQPLPLQLQE